MWGLLPAAGAGSRIQPLACSKELLPVGIRMEANVARPKAVSEYLVERMILAGVDKLCFVISPGKADILGYYTERYPDTDVLFVVQPRPLGLCDALFRAERIIPGDESVLVGLPDTVWFPEDAFRRLGPSGLSFLLFPVPDPQHFDAVVTDERGRVLEIQVKSAEARTRWIWGGFRLPARVYRDLCRLWIARGRVDEYLGGLVNAYIAGGGEVWGVRAGESYIDVGTLEGFRKAMGLLGAGTVGAPAGFDVPPDRERDEARQKMLGPAGILSPCGKLSWREQAR